MKGPLVADPRPTVLHLTADFDASGGQYLLYWLLTAAVDSPHRPVVCAFGEGSLRSAFEDAGVAPAVISAPGRWGAITGLRELARREHETPVHGPGATGAVLRESVISGPRRARREGRRGREVASGIPEHNALTRPQIGSEHVDGRPPGPGQRRLGVLAVADPHGAQQGAGVAEGVDPQRRWSGADAGATVHRLTRWPGDIRTRRRR